MKILSIRPAAIVVALVFLAGCADAETRRQGEGESASTAELRAALETLVSGSDQVVGESASTWFSAETADALRSVAVDSAGHAVVDVHDLRPLIPNASSSAGSAALLNELNATVFQFADIHTVEYRMDGSCDRFWEWLQYGRQTVTRESAQAWR